MCRCQRPRDLPVRQRRHRCLLLHQRHARAHGAARPSAGHAAAEAGDGRESGRSHRDGGRRPEHGTLDCVDNDRSTPSRWQLKISRVLRDEWLVHISCSCKPPVKARYWHGILHEGAPCLPTNRLGHFYCCTLLITRTGCRQCVFYELG